MQNILNRVIKTNIYLLVFLLPLFFLLFTFEAFEFNKQYLLFFLTSLTLFLWLAKIIFIDKEFRFRRSPLDIFVLLFLFVAVLSAIFSVDKNSSLFGVYGRFSDGLIGLLCFGIFYFIITNNVIVKPQIPKNKNWSLAIGVWPLLKVFLWSSFFAVLTAYFSIFGIWAKISALLGDKLPLAIQQAIFNPVAGSLEALAMFVSVAMVFLASWMVMEKKSGPARTARWLLLLAILFLLIIIDFTPAWLVALAGLIFFVSVSLWKRLFREDVNRLLLPIFLIVLAGFFLSVNRVQLMQDLNLQFVPVLPQEQVLSQSASLLVGAKAAVESPKSAFLGSGIGTFHYDFAKFKPESFNQTALWQIRYDRAGNHVAEIIGTMGLLGLMSYLAVIGMFLLVSWLIIGGQNPKIKKTEDDSASETVLKPYGLSLLAAFVALLAGQLVFYQNTVLAFLFWFFLALSVVNWQKPVKERVFSFKDFPELALVFSVSLIVFGVFLLGLYFFAGRFYLADMNYRSATSDTLIKNLEKAASLNPYQPYYRIVLSRAYFAEAMSEMQKPADEKNQVLIIQDIYLAINYNKGGQIGTKYIKGATELAPNKVAAWETLGLIYRDIQGTAAGALEWSIKSFERAISLEPTNPVLYTELGKLYLSSDTAKARELFEKAKTLKPDYAPVLIQLALLAEKENNLEEAIKQMESVAADYPSIDVFFQLGKLYFNNGQTSQAISQFENVVSLMPNHSNALYALGVAHQVKREKEKAIAMFERVLELNPGNADVRARLNELKATNKEK